MSSLRTRHRRLKRAFEESQQYEIEVNSSFESSVHDSVRQSSSEEIRPSVDDSSIDFLVDIFFVFSIQSTLRCHCIPRIGMKSSKHRTS